MGRLLGRRYILDYSCAAVRLRWNLQHDIWIQHVLLQVSCSRWAPCGLDGFDARDDYDHRVGGHGHPEVMMIISETTIIV